MHFNLFAIIPHAFPRIPMHITNIIHVFIDAEEDSTDAAGPPSKKHQKAILERFSNDSRYFPPGLSGASTEHGGSGKRRGPNVVMLGESQLPDEAKALGCVSGVISQGYELYEHPDVEPAWNYHFYVACRTTLEPTSSSATFVSAGQKLPLQGYDEALDLVAFVRDDTNGAIGVLFYLPPEFRPLKAAPYSHWTANWGTALRVCKPTVVDWEALAQQLKPFDAEDVVDGRAQGRDVLRRAIRETQRIRPRGIKLGLEAANLTFTMPKSTVSHPSDLKRRTQKIAVVSTSETHPLVAATKTRETKPKTTPIPKKAKAAASKTPTGSAVKVEQENKAAEAPTAARPVRAELTGLASVHNLVTLQGQQLERMESDIRNVQGVMATLKREFRDLAATLAPIRDISGSLQKLGATAEAIR